MFEVPESASPEGFRGTHRSGTLLQGGYCNDITLLVFYKFSIFSLSTNSKRSFLIKVINIKLIICKKILSFKGVF